MPTRSPIGSEVRTLDMGCHATGAACPRENVCHERRTGATWERRAQRDGEHNSRIR
jgi:hypothetical protein